MGSLSIKWTHPVQKFTSCVKLRLHWWLFQAAAMQFIRCIAISAQEIAQCGMLNFLCNLFATQKKFATNFKFLQQNQFKLILFQVLAIFSRNSSHRLDVTLLFSRVWSPFWIGWKRYAISGKNRLHNNLNQRYFLIEKGFQFDIYTEDLF